MEKSMEEVSEGERSKGEVGREILDCGPNSMTGILISRGKFVQRDTDTYKENAMSRWSL